MADLPPAPSSPSPVPAPVPVAPSPPVEPAVLVAAPPPPPVPASPASSVVLVEHVSPVKEGWSAFSFHIEPKLTEIIVAPALASQEPPIPQKALEEPPPKSAVTPIVVVEKKPDPPVIVVEKKPEPPIVVLEKKAEPPVVVIEEKKKSADPPMIVVEQKKTDPPVVIIEKQPEKKVAAPVVVENTAERKPAEPVVIVMQPTATSKPVSAWVKDVLHAHSESKLRQMQNAESTSTLNEDLYDEPKLVKTRSDSLPRRKMLDTVVFKERSRWHRFLDQVCCRTDIKSRSVNYRGTRYYMDKNDQHETSSNSSTRGRDRARHHFMHEGVLHVLVGRRGSAIAKPLAREVAHKERHMRKSASRPARHTQYDHATRRRERPVIVRSAEPAKTHAHQGVHMHRAWSRGRSGRPRSVQGVEAEGY